MMASHVIGPFMVANAPLEDDVITRLSERTEWGWETAAPVPPFTGPRKVFRARAKQHHGRQRGQIVTIGHEREVTLTLPRRESASPIPQGSGEAAGLLFGPLPADSYGSGPYGAGPYGGEPL